MKYFMFFWLLTGVGTVVAQFVPQEVAMIISFITLGIVLLQFISSFFTDKFYMSVKLNSLLAFFFGFSLYHMLNFYVGEMGGNIVLGVVISAVVLFSILGYIGMKIEKDLSGIYSYLSVFLLAIVVVSLIGFILPFGSTFGLIIAALSLGVFSIFTLVEFNMIAKGHASKKDAHYWGFQLYLNLFNMILDLLRVAYAIFGDD